MTKYTLEQIVEHTGLKNDFVRKVLKHLRDILKPYEERGEFNRLLYNQSGLIIFDKIKQLKEQGLAIPEIKRRLEATNIPTQTLQPKHDILLPQTDQTENYLQRLVEIQYKFQQDIKGERERSDRIIREKEKELTDLSLKYQALDSAVKLLPEGKTPEQIRQDWEMEQRKKIEIASILSEIRTLSTLRFRKRKALIRRLEELSGVRMFADQTADQTP